MIRNLLLTAGGMALAQQSMAEVALAVTLGDPLSLTLGGVLPEGLPIGIGGAASIAAVTLVLGVQLIKRKK